MFLYALHNEQKLPFLALAKAVIHADGVTAPEEMDLLALMKIELEQPADVEIPRLGVSAATRAFPERSERIAVMLELIGLAYSEGELHLREKALLDAVMEEFDIQAAEYEALENWVLRQIALTQEAVGLMSGKR